MMSLESREGQGDTLINNSFNNQRKGCSHSTGSVLIKFDQEGVL